MVKTFLENNKTNMLNDLAKLVSYNSVLSDDAAPFGKANQEVLDEALKMFEKLESNFEEEKEHLIAKLKEACEYIFCPENLLVSVTCGKDALKVLEEPLKILKNCLKPVKVQKDETESELSKKNEGFLTSSQVQYVAVAGNFKKAGLDYTGALRVLKVILKPI